jgi:hypothetical protein
MSVDLNSHPELGKSGLLLRNSEAFKSKKHKKLKCILNLIEIAFFLVGVNKKNFNYQKI